MEHDYLKRGYLLPIGCKDLIDALRLKDGPWPKHRLSQHPNSWPPVVDEIFIPKQTSVQQLAVLLGRHPSRIIVDLLELGVYAGVQTQLEFRKIYKLARKYGYEAKIAA